MSIQAATVRPADGVPSSDRPAATRVAVAVVGVVAGYAGIEHGIGELRQGFIAPDSLLIESWPDTEAFEVLSGEPAMTVVPNLAVTGVLAILASLAVAVWAVRFAHRRHGGVALVALSVVLLLVGGGFGPPVIGAIAGIAAATGRRGRLWQPGASTRALASLWPWSLIGCVVAYLSLVPGVVLLSHFAEFESELLVTGLAVVAFTTLILSFVSARATDQLRTTSGRMEESAALQVPRVASKAGESG